MNNRGSHPIPGNQPNRLNFSGASKKAANLAVRLDCHAVHGTFSIPVNEGPLHPEKAGQFHSSVGLMLRSAGALGRFYPGVLTWLSSVRPGARIDIPASPFGAGDGLTGQSL